MKNLKLLKNNLFYFILLILVGSKNASFAQIINLKECDIINFIDNKNEFFFINLQDLSDIKDKYIRKNEKVKGVLKINTNLKILVDSKKNKLIVIINGIKKEIFFNKKIDQIKYNGFFFFENNYELYFSIYNNKCLNYIGISEYHKKWKIAEYMSFD